MRVPLAALLLLALSAPAAAIPGAKVCNAGLPGDHRAGLDDDGDAIPDSEDWCAQTPAGARVGSDGCAPGEVPVGCSTRPLQPVPKPKPVEEPAAAAEPAPSAAAASAATAAAEIEKVVLSGVSFEMGSSTLRPEAAAPLKTVAEMMKAHRTLQVEIGGHSDAIGDKQKNQGLSERRANSVKAFLVDEGVYSARLTAVGYGETQPVASNDTPDGRAANRRVAFKVIRDRP